MPKFATSAGLCTVVLFVALAWSGTAMADDVATPSLVPWPQKVSMRPGVMMLTDAETIIAVDQKLLPLAKILADEIAAETGLRYKAVVGTVASAKAGDIALLFDPKLKAEAHTLTIGQSALVTGGDYAAVAFGTITLLQAIQADKGKHALPQITIADEPRSPFRGLLIDVARKFHSIENLKQIVQLCRLYKINYLQLHLTDDPLFMFPSTTYPQLGSKNDGGVQPYTLAQLKDLVAYADARGVTIIPEYEVPGHSAAANRAMPDLFKIKGTKPYEHHASINFAKPDVMAAVETIVGEMCDVFQSSPYFHIGGDEADFQFADQNEFFQAAEKKSGLPDHHELYRKFIVDMNEIVKRRGKKMIVWEGFGRAGKMKIPTDVIVMAYEIRFYKPGDLVKDGYNVINASWTPLYVVNANARPPAEIYAWNLFQFKPYGAKADAPGTVIPPTDRIIGAQMCAWEQPQEQELPSLRGRLPAMAERLWNPTLTDGAHFQKRWTSTDKLLTGLPRASVPFP